MRHKTDSCLWGNQAIPMVALVLLVAAGTLTAAPPGGGGAPAARPPAATSAAATTSAPATPPTKAVDKAGFFDLHESNVPPAAFLGGAMPAGAGDAADDYRKAALVYRAEANDIAETYLARAAEIASGKCKPPAGLLAALEKIASHVAAGAAKKEMHYTTPEQVVVRYANEQASQLVRVAEALALLVYALDADKKYPEEEKVLRSIFLLGRHMERERVRATMTIEGLNLQSSAVGMIADLYRRWEPQTHAAELKAVAECAREMQNLRRAFQEKLFVVWKVEPNPGDVFAVVERDQDRAWRVEALLVAGVVRYTHPESAGDQKAARELLDRFAADPDPFVKAAATAARELTKKAFDHVSDPPEP